MPRAQPLPDDGDELIGREVIGQYVVRERLADGGMGALYLAEQPSVGRSAVIKILGGGPRARERAARFDVEARAASQLNHPHIVTIYNYGTMENGTRFLAMEHLDGRSLEDVIDEEAPLETARALAIVRQIGAALVEAHARGVVHRDLKPSNVMLVTRGDEREFVKVLDFGVAKMKGVELTISGEFCGTPAYMSPEQFRDAQIDGRTDLYSLAIVIFEMLTGKTPFVSDTPVGYMGKHLAHEPPTITRGDVPAALAALVARALAKDPSSRPSSVAVFLEELDVAMKPAPLAIPERPWFEGVSTRARELWSQAREWLRPRKKRRWKRSFTRALDRWPFRRKPTWKRRLGRARDKLKRSLVAWFRRS